MSTHQLAEDVFSCLSDNRLVFLDLRRDQYLCLNLHNTRDVIHVFDRPSAFEVASPDKELAADPENIQRAVQALTDRGLLVPNGTSGKDATFVHVQAVDNSLLSEQRSQKPTVFGGYRMAFLRATLTASLKLRCFSMHRTVQSVANRKQQSTKSEVTDYDVLYDLVTIFHHLRPYYVRKYLCLFDSLALVEFLANFGIFPQWIFGVNAAPFNAHCWVQKDDYVLNDSVERISRYTPIMAV